MMLAAMVALAVCTDRVSLEIDGATVRRTIELIAEASQSDLRVRDDANVNTLAIYAQDVPLEALLDRIADATGTVWETVGDVRTLITTDETDARIEREETERRKAAIERAKGLIEVSPTMQPREIEALATRAELAGKDLEVWTPSEEQRAVIADIQSKKPIGRLAQVIARELRTEDLARVNRDNPLVFSNNPVGSEHRVPNSILGAFEDYKKEFAVWQSAILKSVAAYPVKNPEDPRFGVGESDSPTTLHITTDVLAERSYIRVMVRTADREGRIVDFWYAVLRPEMANKHFMLEPDVTFPVPMALRETRAFFMRQESISDESGVRQVGPEVSERLRKPLEHDPVSLGIGPLLIAIAKAAKKNLVACVSDFALDWYGWPGGLGAQWQANAVFSQADSMWESDIKADHDWLVVSPRSIVTARSKYYDRRALARIFSIQSENKMISIEDATAYAGDQESALAFRGYDWRVVMRHATFSGNIGDAHLLHWESEKPLRVLASLNNDERSRAGGPGGVPVSQLNVKAKRAIEKWLADSGAIYQGFRMAGQADFGVRNLSGFPSRSGRDLKLFVAESSEPMTFRYGTGIPANLPFSDYLEYSGTIYQDAQENTPDVYVQMGTLRKIELRLVLPDGAFIAIQVDQSAAPPSDTWMRPRDLPGETLRLLRNAHERGGGGHIP